MHKRGFSSQLVVGLIVFLVIASGVVVLLSIPPQVGSEDSVNRTIRQSPSTGTGTNPGTTQGSPAMPANPENQIPTLEPECDDEGDNDGDGWIDSADPGCTNEQDLSESNGVRPYQCSDGIDNDNDGKIDGNDPGCASWQDTNETDTIIITQCNDGIDNDNNGLTDYPVDIGCTNAADDAELSDSLSSQPLFAISWAPVSSSLGSTITSVIRVTPETNAASLKQELDQKPEGRKAIQSWHFETYDTYHGSFWLPPEDRCIDSSGAYTAYYCPWLYNYTSTIKARMQNFFNTYKQIGGKVDIVVLDTEQGFSRWQVTEAQLAAIQSDPRFSTNDARFPQSDIRYRALATQLGTSDLNKVWSYTWTGHSSPEPYYYVIWNNLLIDWVHAYQNDAIYAPIRQHFPSVKLSQYEAVHRSPSLYVPDEAGHNDSYCSPGLYCSTGSHVGTEQAPRLLYDENVPMIGNAPLTLSGQTYTQTSFNGFKYNVNRVREAYLASTSTPMSPWVAFKSLTDARYYEEALLHVLLLRTEYVLYWNPKEGPPSDATDADDEAVAKSIDEYNKLVGYSSKQIRTTTLTDWKADYVLSGALSMGRKVWRFTPNTDDSSSAQSKIVSETPQGVVVQTAQARITFTDGRIHRPANPVSSRGLWIIQPQNAPDPNIQAL